MSRPVWCAGLQWTASWCPPGCILIVAVVLTEQITIAVDPDVAKRYRSASDQQRRKLDLLANLRLRDATQGSASLEQVIDNLSRAAQGRGLTPEILQSILDEDSLEVRG